MHRTITRALVVAAIALGGLATGAAVAVPAQAATVCYVNGVQAPCPKPDYENDCEGVLQRPDCNAPAPTTQPAPEPTQDPTTDSQPAKKAPKVTKTEAPKTSHTTSTQTGQSVTTVTVDEASGAVTTVTEEAQAFHERRGVARLGGDTA